MIEWRTEADPWLAAILVTAAATSVPLMYAGLRRRVAAGQAALMLAPRCALLALLTVALFEPVIRRAAALPPAGTVLFLLDVSASMDVRDHERGSRAERARAALGQIRAALPRGVAAETWKFDIEPRLAAEPPAPPAARTPGTDLGASLSALALGRKLPPPSCLVLLSDGGDDPAPPETLPDMPVFALGFGTDPAGWNDVAIESIQAPATAERGVSFELACDLRARACAGSPFAGALDAVKVRLEQREGEQWALIDEKTGSLAHGRLRVVFSQTPAEAGIREYRVSAAPLEGELSALNNTRRLSVETRRKSLRVLYFTRELGADFRALRRALAMDPGIAFTALYRTDGERFTIQGERIEGDAGMAAGFPEDPALLKRYDCVIIGSFPAPDWTSEQALALVRYVEEGGAAIFTGGEHAPEAGGYSGFPLAGLFPWTLPGDTTGFLRGVFPVRVAPGADHHPMVAGLPSAADEPGCVVESLLAIGSLKPGAERILVALMESGEHTLAAVHAVGRGRVLALASNTFWKWAQKTDGLRNAHDRFWRQAVRALADAGEGAVLSVKWDREKYRAGDTAHAHIRVAPPAGAAPVALRGACKADGRAEPVALSETGPGAYSAALPLPRRGEYRFELNALMNGSVIETHEKAFMIGALPDEGARLEVNAEILRRLAERSGGAYLPESEVKAMAGKIAGRFVETQRVVEQPLVDKWRWFLPAILALMLAEWLLRRRMNLI